MATVHPIHAGVVLPIAVAYSGSLAYCATLGSTDPDLLLMSRSSITLLSDRGTP